MSGLNVWTRAILRFANWIAGERSSEWCAAMAAETDAAGSQGMHWAMGCVGAALKMRLRTDWKRIGLLICAPFFVYAISIPWFFAVTMTMRDLAFDAPVTWAILLKLPMLIMLLLAVRFALRGIPTVFIVYAVAACTLTPLVHFALKFDTSPWIFFGADAQWMTLPRNQGMALELGLIFMSIAAGWIWRSQRLKNLA
ncbi:hypothetical protein BPTFM16_01377 [Altererythrobacter insulae]|nr:hypothetical protein BPTFM16_01377 [Altererythrobacter insulae]